MEAEYPECPICLDIYGTNEDHLKAPKILRCGHSFCKECILKLLNKEEINNKITCPICNKSTEKIKDIDEYITNFDVINYVNQSFNLQKDDKPVISYKIICLGDSGVGKTSIFQRLFKDNFDIVSSSVGVGVSLYYLKYKKNKYKLELIDTAGAERYRALSTNYIKNSDGVFFVFDLSVRKTFDNLENWYKFYIENNDKSGVLIGNKSDIERDVTYEEAKKFADDHELTYFETSAKLDKNIKKAVAVLLSKIIATRLFTSLESVKSLDGCEAENIQLTPEKSLGNNNSNDCKLRESSMKRRFNFLRALCSFGH